MRAVDVVSKDIVLRRRKARINFNKNVGCVSKIETLNISRAIINTYLCNIPGRMLFGVKLKYPQYKSSFPGNAES